ncbi:hypothetical protein H476_0992 [[Clostridium] sordellii VPI 9048]|nr:hypothetical protein H476_0992 [[Clostridium] sordellii VPI 9048] [Paeniclostridium sordellii VPI 9048]
MFIIHLETISDINFKEYIVICFKAESEGLEPTPWANKFY